ncbi:MAG: NfeD family protein [Dehalococcoidales bacterium]|nr:NfeD family protein [Dehalococcoidales bacterium]
MTRLTKHRLILGIISTCAEETAIWIIWRWVLPAIDINLSVSVLIGAMIAWLIFSILTFVLVTNILNKQKPGGRPTMIGAKGKASGALKPEGMVRIKGELWKAVADGGNMEDGARVVVVAEDGMRLTVRRDETFPAKR